MKGNRKAYLGGKIKTEGSIMACRIQELSPEEEKAMRAMLGELERT